MWKKIVLFIIGGVVVLIGGGLAFLYLKPVSMSAPSNIKVERTPERVARGKYLFEVVSSCWHCHSATDPSRFGEPIVAGKLASGRVMPEEMGFPGRVVASNLSSDPETGAGNWSDGQLLRAIREGIGHDDRVLFPLMPYSDLARMSDEDTQSIVAYMRTLPPVRNDLPKTSIKFPVNLLIKSEPKPAPAVASVDRSNRLEYGKYLVTIAGCVLCHTPVDGSEHPIPGKEFSGGRTFLLAKDARAVSANLTPDPETGSGRWTEPEFLDKFYQYKKYAVEGPPKIDPVNNTLMPWLAFSRMEADDLKAIFGYLRTVPAISNAVVTHPDAPEEKDLMKRKAGR